MKEIEVKILEVNRMRIADTLSKLGAKKIFDSEIHSLFFDFQDGRIAKAKDVLRLRKEPDKIDLAYKKIETGETAVKSAEEYSVEVSSMEEAEKILENLGLHKTDDMLKHRLSYKIDNIRFDLDRYLGRYSFIPDFLEIEAENIKAIYKYADLLGYKAKDCLPWSTTELIEHYSAKKEKV
jgi:adenylate cyclase, class 2